MSLTRRQTIKLFGGALLATHFGVRADQSKPLPLNQFKGKLILADFWASWCVPCQKSFPWLNEISNKYQTHGLVVLGVNVDAEKNDAENFLREHPATFPIIYDPTGTHASFYDIQGMPSSLLLSSNGQVIHRHVGFISAQETEYEAALKKALNI